MRHVANEDELSSSNFLCRRQTPAKYSMHLRSRFSLRGCKPLILHLPGPACCDISWSCLLWHFLVLRVVTFPWSCILWYFPGSACCDISLILHLWHFLGTAYCNIRLVLRVVIFPWSYELWQFLGPSCCAISLILRVVPFPWFCLLWHSLGPACCVPCVVLSVVIFSWFCILWGARPGLQGIGSEKNCCSWYSAY